MNGNKKNLIIITTLIMSIIFLILWLNGLIGLWMDGMAYVANNTTKFSDSKGHILQGEYSITIDLANLESNIGKDLYNDGVHRIYVDLVDNTGSPRSGGYRIIFRASGQYSLNSATLISGVHHATVNNNLFTMTMSAKMTAEYNGKTYHSNEFGESGLNYKDGDDFSFYIFPYESYKKGEVSLNEKGIVHLTVTNLYENIWSKK